MSKIIYHLTVSLLTLLFVFEEKRLLFLQILSLLRGTVEFIAQD